MARLSLLSILVLERVKEARSPFTKASIHEKKSTMTMNGASPVTQNTNPLHLRSAREFYTSSSGLFSVGFVLYRTPQAMSYSLLYTDAVWYLSYARRWNAHPGCLCDLGCRRYRIIRPKHEQQHLLYLCWLPGCPVPSSEIRNRQIVIHLLAW